MLEGPGALVQRGERIFCRGNGPRNHHDTTQFFRRNGIVGRLIEAGRDRLPFRQQCRFGGETLSDASAKQDVTGSSSSVVPVAEEEINLTKREVATGEVRVRTVTHVVEELAKADLKQDRVIVTRVPVDRIVDSIPSIRVENGVTIIPVAEEVLFVEKRLVLKEEMHIRRTVETETVAVPVSLRKQEGVVERIAPQNQDPSE